MWILLALLVTGVVANDNLRVAYQWKQIDFEYPNIDERQAAITNLTFISENVIPVGLEVYKNRLFITLPRWKKGVPASLAYIDLNGKYHHARLSFLIFEWLQPSRTSGCLLWNAARALIVSFCGFSSHAKKKPLRIKITTATCIRRFPEKQSQCCDHKTY